MKWRLVIVNVVVTLVAGGIWLKLVYWQVLAADELRGQAANQRMTVVEMPGVRGEILAADGFPLAANEPSWMVYINPKLVDDNPNWQKLIELLPASDSAFLKEKLGWNHLSWVSIASQVSPQTRTLIEQLNLEGLGFEEQPVRFYPEGSSSAHLLGFVGKDASGKAVGYFGLEGYYDRLLLGRPGKMVLEQDALGRPIVISGSDFFPSQAGQSVVTSVDRSLQFILGQKLAKGLQRYGAISGTITVMDPDTGAVLAMVSLPNYDPAAYQYSQSSLFTNPVVAEGYEPGSTFKVVTMAAALDAGAVKADTTCNICTGPVRVAEYLIRTWNDKYFPNSTMNDVIMHSDNVGMVFVARKLGLNKFLEYLSRFGLREKTGIDLQDEALPEARPDNVWGEVDLATAAFGQGIAVTPIQMLQAVAVIANGGKLPHPRVSQAALQSTTQSVISPTAAAQVTQMMIKAVEEGEAKWAKPVGYTVAGKTGTAQIPIAGHYDQEKTIASFVGFAPAYDPKFVMLVTLREPKSSPWGSETAAPLWFEVAAQLFRHFQIGPDRAS